MNDAMMTDVRLHRPKRPDRMCLFHVASGQAGYFTAEQARGCGFSRALLAHHAKSGRFIRIRHGLYRLREYPSSSREHVLAAWLAVGKDIAIVSHESALDLLDLSDVIPETVHLTVPRSRRSLPSIPEVKIHTTDRSIELGERWVREGMPVTSAARSILDAAEKGANPEQIELAVAQAIERGLANTEELRRAASRRSRRVAELIAGALCKVAAEAIDLAPAAHPTAPRVSGSSLLTTRELEVVALIADGLTNRQIAERLIVSKRTIDAHVRHIMEKLDLSSRTQVAVWATTSVAPRL